MEPPNAPQTVYQFYGNDQTVNTADDLYSHYLFDHVGRTVNAYTTDVNNNILGATNAVYTVDETDTHTDKKNNRIQQTASIGASAINLLHNAGFESSNYVWTFSNASRATTKAHTGQYAMKASPTAVSTAVSATRTISLTADTTYTFSAYVNTSELTSASGSGVYLKVTDSSSKSFTGYASAGGGVNYITSEDVDGGWIRIYLTFTAKTTGTHTIGIYGSGVVGTFYADDVQLEADDAASSANLMENGSAETAYYGWSLTPPFVAGKGWNASRALYINGSPTSVSNLYQTVNIYLPADQTYVLSGWANANAVPDNLNASGVDEAQDQYKQFGLQAMITYSDGKTEYHYVPFNADLSDEWQFASLTIVPKRADEAETASLKVNTIRVYLAYERNANTAYFDNISLTREAAQTMTTGQPTKQTKCSSSKSTCFDGICIYSSNSSTAK